MEPFLLQGRNGTKAGEETIQHEGREKKKETIKQYKLI